MLGTNDARTGHWDAEAGRRQVIPQYSSCSAADDDLV